MTRRLLPLLLCLAAATGAFAHSGEWGTVPPPVTYPPNPLPKWPGPHTMTPKDPAAEAPRAPGRRTPRGATRSGWSRWWDLHRERILAPPAPAPLPDEHRKKILVALRIALTDKDTEVATSAIIALGRARDVDAAPILQKFLHQKATSVSVLQSSLIALGLIDADHEPSRKVVRDVLASDRWSTEVRACAALAIGLSGDANGLSLLAELLGNKKAAPGLRAAAAAGLGLLGDDRSAPDLAKILSGGGETDPGVRAWAAAALANVKSGAGRTALMAGLSDLDLGVSRQAALSLGAYSDPWARKALLKALRSDGDPVTRAYAGLALADAGDPAAKEPLLAAVRSGDEVLAPHAAVALGLLARRTTDGKTKAAARLSVTTQLSDLTPIDLAGALVASGALAGADGLRERFARMVASGADPELRGHAAFALGMLGADDAPLLPLVAEATPLPVLREVGRACAWIGSEGGEKRFRDLLAAGGRESTRCVAAVTLGLFRRESGGAALLAVLADSKQPGLVRGCAAVGLGRRLETTRPSPLALAPLRLSPELVGGPVREVISMR